MSEEAQTRPPEVFSASVAVILFLVGVFAFSAFITLSTFAPDFQDGDDARGHALSKSAIGYAGIVRLLKGDGTHVTVSRNSSHAGFVVFTPETKLKKEDLARLAEVEALIILPKWLPTQSLTHKGWSRNALTLSESSVEDVLTEIAPKAAIKRETKPRSPVLSRATGTAPFVHFRGGERTGEIAEMQTIVAPELEPIVTTPDGKTILGQIKNSEDPAIYVLAEPDLVNNQGLAKLTTAKAGLAILNSLRAEKAPITFDVTLNGFERSRSLLRLALQPPLLAATLSFVIVAGMIAWRAATRSGPTERGKRALALGKRTLADNSAALIRLAGRDHTMAPRYAEMIRTVVAEEIKVSRDANETTVAELDRIAMNRGVRATYSELANEAAAAHTATETLTAARRLHAWIGDMIRATR